MKDLTIEYRRFFLKRKITRSVPEGWAEITAGQLIAISRLINGDIREDEYLKQFFALPKSVGKHLGPYQKWNVGQLLQFSGAFDPWYVFILELKGLKAPRPRLEGMSFGQFMFVDTYYGDWIKEESPELLNKFVGSLYLPANEIFSTEKTAAYIRNAAQLKGEEKLAITLNYRLVKEWLSNLYPILFPHPEEDPETEKKPAAAATGGWLQVFESIVGDDLIHQEAYFDLPVHTVLRFLTKKIKENAKG
jgi:hypothetical protein